MYFATMNGPIQVGGHGHYGLKTIAPYVAAHGMAVAFLHDITIAFIRWIKARHG